MERFCCTHCGHHFESEAKETVVCPHCFWSTSVKKEEPEKQEKITPSSPRPAVSIPTEESGSGRGRYWIAGVLSLALIGGVSVFTFRYLKGQDEILQKIKTKNAQVIATQAPELRLSDEERQILHRKVPLEANRPLTAKESKVLEPGIPLRSRSSRGVATPPWDPKQFEEFLKGAEVQYRLPLEWSYRRKLIALFKEHALPAAQAFEARDFLKARDEWIRSLAFPVFRNDLRRHRGVVLTMLRPYINDTLSKIGSMNASLTGSDLDAPEEKIRSSYQNLIDLLRKQSWEEASAKVLELSKQIDDVENSPAHAANPPPLPREISLVDQDIREVLMAQVAPVETSLPDWTALRRDLAEKEKVIQARMPERVQDVQKEYEEALVLIQGEDWARARDLLRKIEFPPEWVDDARAKIQILDRLVPPSLDSERNSG